MRLFTNLAISLAALVFALISAEVGIRIWNRYDPLFRPDALKDHYEFLPAIERVFSPYRPHSTGMTHGHIVRINNLGFRGPDVAIEKRPGQFRILALGDSFTFGTGIAEEDRYADVMQERLRQRYPRLDVEIVNAGIPGASAVDEAALLTRLGPILDPDLILIGFVGNDVVQAYAPRGWQIPLPDRLKFYAESRSSLCAFLTDRYDRLLMVLGLRQDDLAASTPSYDPHSQDWRDFLSAYGGMLDWTRTRQIPPPIVGLFFSGSVRPNDRGYDYNKPGKNLQTFIANMHQVQQALDRMGIPAIDYLRSFQQHGHEVLGVSQWESHPNARANRMYADGFLQASALEASLTAAESQRRSSSQRPRDATSTTLRGARATN